MKNFLFVVFCSFIAFNVFATDSAVVADAQSTTTGGQIAVSINPSLFSAPQGQIGINGLAVRFIDSKGSGIEIPFGLTYNYTNDSGATFPFNLTASISSGMKFIRPVFSNDFFRVSVYPGFTVSYSETDENYNNSLAKDYYYTYTAGVAAIGGIEVEAFIDKAFSLPYHSLSLSSGLNLSVGASFGETTDNFTDKTNKTLDTRNYSRKFVYNGGVTSTGTSLSTITIRYYF